MTITDTKQLVEQVWEKAQEKAGIKAAAQPTYAAGFVLPKVENYVNPTPIENKVEVKGAQVTVSTKELGEYVAKAIAPFAAQNDVLAAKLDALVDILTKLFNRPPAPPVVNVAAPVVHVPPFPAIPPAAKPKRIRLETDDKGNRHAVPEY